MADVPTRTLLDYLSTLTVGGEGGVVTRDLTIREDIPTTQQVVPPGGSTGEVLAKLGDDDYDIGWALVAGTGTVKTVSIKTDNGFSGTSNGDPENPTITLSTTVTGLLKGDGTDITAATGNTDYQLPVTLTTSGTSGAATFDGTTLNIPNYSFQVPITLTTTGTSGVATFNGVTLNIPNYTSSAITELTGDVTAGPGSGSQAATIADSAVTAGKLASNSVTTVKITNSNVTYAKIQNVSATSRMLGRKTAGAGVTEELTLSEALDFIGSATRGDILYRGASTWSRLAKGTSGQVLTIGANDPAWADAPSTGQPIPTTSSLPVGSFALLGYTGSSTVADNSTTSGSNLSMWTGAGNNAAANGGTQSGTWKNITGVSVSSGSSNVQRMYAVRTA